MHSSSSSSNIDAATSATAAATAADAICAVATSSFLLPLFIIVLVSDGCYLSCLFFLACFYIFFWLLISSAFCCNSFWPTPLKSMVIMTRTTTMMAVHILAFAFAATHIFRSRVFDRGDRSGFFFFKRQFYAPNFMCINLLDIRTESTLTFSLYF